MPRSRATPVSASPGRRAATRTETGNPAAGGVANGVARATVTLPSAIRPSRSVAARAGVNGVPAEAEVPAAMLSSAAVATTALPRKGTGATALPSASAAEHASR